MSNTETVSVDQRVHDLAIAYLIAKYTGNVCDERGFIDEYNVFVRRSKKLVDVED